RRARSKGEGGAELAGPVVVAPGAVVVIEEAPAMADDPLPLPADPFAPHPVETTRRTSTPASACFMPGRAQKARRPRPLEDKGCSGRDGALWPASASGSGRTGQLRYNSGSPSGDALTGPSFHGIDPSPGSQFVKKFTNSRSRL